MNHGANIPEEDRIVMLLARPQEKQYARVKEIERLAKLLEKEVDEKSKLTNINQYFEEDDPSFNDDKGDSQNYGLRHS